MAVINPNVAIVADCVGITSGTYIARYIKHPLEDQDYDIDFTSWLATRNDSILSYTVGADAGITLATSTQTGSVIRVFMVGGSDKSSYEVQVTVTTLGGLVKVATIFIRVKGRGVSAVPPGGSSASTLAGTLSYVEVTSSRNYDPVNDKGKVLINLTANTFTITMVAGIGPTDTFATAVEGAGQLLLASGGGFTVTDPEGLVAGQIPDGSPIGWRVDQTAGNKIVAM